MNEIQQILANFPNVPLHLMQKSYTDQDVQNPDSEQEIMWSAEGKMNELIEAINPIKRI